MSRAQLAATKEKPVSRQNKIWAVITSFNDPAALAVCVEALVSQVDMIVVVDNKSEPEHQQALSALESRENFLLHRAPENLGIGAAMNIGLVAADAEGANWVLLMDQDSIAAPDMIEAMLVAAARLPNAAFTPAISGIGSRREATVPFEVTYAITSGNLIPVAALRAIGGLDEGLFIDGVDFDLSLRLRRAGYRLFQVPGAHMGHSLGDASSPGGLLGRFHTSHSPLRRYYMARNLVLNLRRHALTFPKFCGKLVIVSGLSFLSVLRFGPRRRESAAMMFRGFADGVRGKIGPYQRS